MALSEERFRQVCNEMCTWLRGFAPKDTGNLAYNAIKIEFPSTKECLIYVDESIAPYMPFTTRPWVSPRWNGKKNPNEDWWQMAGVNIYERLRRELKGKSTNKNRDNVLWDDYKRWFKNWSHGGEKGASWSKGESI